MKLILYLYKIAISLCLVGAWACGKSEKVYFKAPKAIIAPKIDGKSDDECWQSAEWYPIKYVWLGKEPSKSDFEGRFKAVWTVNKLYILAEITDDALVDTNENPLEFYWNDDCFEVFIDEDHSGGNHQYNYNAFAYHIAKDYNVVDIKPDRREGLYNDHVEVKRTQKVNTYIWEASLLIYNDTYQDNKVENQLVKLRAGKKMGLMVAYCDNDTSKERENFIGSMPIEGVDKNRAWIDAGLFATLELTQ